MTEELFSLTREIVTSQMIVYKRKSAAYIVELCKSRGVHGRAQFQRSYSGDSYWSVMIDADIETVEQIRNDFCTRPFNAC